LARLRRLGTWVLILVVVSGITPVSGAELSARGIKQQLAQVSRRMQETRSRLRAAKRQRNYAIQNLQVAERRLAVSQARLVDIRSQLRRTRVELQRTRAELAVIRRRLKERNDLLARRIADTYKHGSISYLSVLLGAADFSELLSRGYVVRKVLKKDAELIEAIKRDEAAVKACEARLEQQERLRAELEREQAIQTSIAREAAAQREDDLRRIQSVIAELEAAYAELDRTSNRLEAMLRRMLRSRQVSGQNLPMWSGGWLRPVPGPKTSGFGMRMHPILKRNIMHRGVDLAAASGTPIRAAADGIVVSCGYQGGYGNVVIIYHGGDIHTLYAHCSSIIVRVNQNVKQGQVVAYVGSTGLSTGPHLHFEMRKNGVPISPPF